MGAGSLAHIAHMAMAAVARLAPRRPVAVAVSPPVVRPAAALRARLDDLVAAYPDHLASHDDDFLYWRNGARTPLRRAGRKGAPARSIDDILAEPDIVDVFAWDYALGPARAGPAPPGDPGRPRPAALFTRMYGDCRRGEVESRLARVRWVGGRTVRFTRVNGAAAALTLVAGDLEALGPGYAKYLWPISGTFNCRVIAGTRTASMHAYGAAIDLASHYGAYWRWGPDRGLVLPPPVIDAFERHGFIWGGKWAHFDTFHFEFRPELIRAARGSAGASR